MHSDEFTLNQSQVTLVTETSYMYIGALATETSYFYYVTAVAEDGTESLLPSPLACKLRHDLTYVEDGPNLHWLAIPENDEYATANDIGALSPAISEVRAWNATSQSETVWKSDGTGTDFPLQTGQPCAVVITEDTVINLLGTLPAGEIGLLNNPDTFSTNWIHLPQPNIYQTASNLAADIPNATKIGRFDSDTNTYQSWFRLDGTWMGEDFPLTPGEGFLAVVSDNATWTPAQGYPTVTANVDSTEGLNSLTVNLSGTAQDRGGSIVSYEWDFQGDGNIDFSNTLSPAASMTYETGTYHPTLIVTDNSGFKGYDYATVNVYGLANTISLEEFNPGTGASGTFSLELTADGSVTLKIYDADGNLVATPVLDQAVTAGQSDLFWDGTDSTGQTVPDGVYHAVLEYTVNGNTFTYDLRSTGGENITSNIENATVSGTLSPLAGEYIDIAYTLPEKALVTIEVKSNVGDVIRHLLTDAPRTSGDHTETWDGTDDSGVAVAPGVPFIITLDAVALAESAFMATGATPTISSVSGSPLRFSPALNPYGAQDGRRLAISFELNRQADVYASVFSSAGELVRTVTLADATAGANQLVWNGRRDNGMLAADGVYTVRLQASDESNATSTPFVLQTEVFY